MKVNVKNFILVTLFALLAGACAACGGAGPTPTRTPKAIAESATQTPWFIYVPVTTTPEPFTVTPLPTVTSPAPPPKPTNTRAPRPVIVASPTPAQATAIPATLAPAATPTPSCGESYQVTNLILPANGNTKSVPAGIPGGNSAIIFRFTPVVDYPLDVDIGYEVHAVGPASGATRFLSHNEYLSRYHASTGEGIVLDPHAVVGLTGGDSASVTWNVTVVRSSSGFDDQNFQSFGTVTPCGPQSPTNTIIIVVG